MADALSKVAIAQGRKPASFILMVLIEVFLLLGAVVAVNVVVNPRSEFSTDLIPALVPDDPQRTLEGYQALAEPPTTLILGSSRANRFAGYPGEEESTYTFSFDGGTLIDQEDVLDYVLRSQQPPSRFVIVLDQFAFTKEFDPALSWSRAGPEILGRPVPVADKAMLLFRTLDHVYVIDSIRSTRMYLTNDYPPTKPLQNPLLLQPGVVERYENGTFHPSSLGDKLDRKLERMFGDESTLDPSRPVAFDRVVRRALDTGAAVDVLLPPIQPFALDDMRARFSNFDERYAETLAAAGEFCPEIRLFDYTKVESYGGDPLGFRDQTHTNLQQGPVIMAAMAAGRGELCGGPIA